MKKLVRLTIVYVYVILFMLIHFWNAEKHLCKLEDFISKMGFIPDVRLPIEGGVEVHVWEKIKETP